jgi:hypothetical protein
MLFSLAAKDAKIFVVRFRYRYLFAPLHPRDENPHKQTLLIPFL